jgi:hypothetical protein
MTKHDLILHINAPGVPANVVSRAQEQLVGELNEYAPVAEVATSDAQTGTKGAIEIIGQVGLALLSSDAVKYIAQVLADFVKRNDRYEITVGDIKIKGQRQDVALINKQLLKIMAQRSGIERR